MQEYEVVRWPCPPTMTDSLRWGGVGIGLAFLMPHGGLGRAALEVARVRQAHAWSVQQWFANAPPPSQRTISTREELLKARSDFRQGELTPLSEIWVVGPLSQTISKGFNAFLKLDAIEQRAKWEIAGAAADGVGNMIVAAATGGISIPFSIGFKTLKETAYLKGQTKAAFCLPHAQVIYEFVVNGVNCIDNNDDRVLLRWGERTAADAS